MQRVLKVLVPLVVVAAVAAVAVFSAEESASQMTLGQVAGPVEVSGAPLPPLVGSSSSEPFAAPSLRMRSPDGDLVMVGSGSGAVQVIVFLAHWCPACQAEVPHLVEVLDEDGVPDGVEVVAVLTGLDPSRPNWPPYAWFDREGLQEGPYGAGVVRVVRDDAEGTAQRAFGLSAYPGWALVDVSGQVLSRFSGALDVDGIRSVLEAFQQG